jgi:transposase
VGVKLLYLPPYLPDFNPIEEFFAKLKAYIKKTWPAYEEDPD